MHCSGKPYQSKLLPYREQIRQWRKNRVSYQEIARRLELECGCITTASTIFSFVKVRSKRRKVIEMLEEPTGKRISRGFQYDENKPLTLSSS